MGKQKKTKKTLLLRAPPVAIGAQKYFKVSVIQGLIATKRLMGKQQNQRRLMGKQQKQKKHYYLERL